MVQVLCIMAQLVWCRVILWCIVQVVLYRVWGAGRRVSGANLGVGVREHSGVRHARLGARRQHAQLRLARLVEVVRQHPRLGHRAPERAEAVVAHQQRVAQPAGQLLHSGRLERGALAHVVGDALPERDIVIDNLLVRVHLIIEMRLVNRPCATGV